MGSQGARDENEMCRLSLSIQGIDVYAKASGGLGKIHRGRATPDAKCVWSEREPLLCRIMPQDRHDHVLSGGNDVLTAWLLLVVMSVKPYEALWLGECGV